MSNGMTPKEAGILGLFGVATCIGLSHYANDLEKESIENTEIITPTSIEQPYKDWNNE